MELVMNPEISKWREPKNRLAPIKLADDMRKHGQLQNMLARKLPNGKTELVFGHIRHVTLKSLGKKPEDMDIRVVENLSDEEAIMMAYNENQLRTPFSAIEEARAFSTMSRVLKWTHKQIATKTGNSETYVRDRLHLLELPKDVQALILDGKVAISYCMVLRKLDKYPEAQLRIARKIASTQWDALDTIKKAEEAVEEVLATVKRRKELLAKYGSCPKCGSANIDREPFSYNEKKLTCQNCNHVFNAVTKEPWKVFELKQRASNLGLDLKLHNGKQGELTPKETAQIVEERTKIIANIEKPNPAFRSVHSLEQLLSPLISQDSIQTLAVDGEQITIRLIEKTKLHFKAIRKSYQKTGEKCRIVITEGWRDDEKVAIRMPFVKEYESSIK